ncbi:MAG: hypothetical protein CMP75_00480 [Flavobacteriales bacterium]|nr:hypothetical protein [Flavobacteriales bacterium]|tara:strand:- start:92 stop:490 length:399 start_codon:yes stop_codon:yes gene_type:complete
MKKIVIIAFVASMLTACVDTSDLPQIDNLTILNDSIQKAPGAVFQFTVDFSDDNGLSQYRVRVEDDFPNARTQDAPWYFVEGYEINGLSVSESQVIELPYPDLEQGRYRLDVIVQDIDLGESSESQHFFIYE